MPRRELKPLSECIPSLPPGKRIDVLFDIFHERDETTFPDVYEVKLGFYAPALKTHLDDESVLHPGVCRNVLHTTKQLVSEVGRIAKSIEPN